MHKDENKSLKTMIADFEVRILALGISRYKVLRAAGVADSNYYQWRLGKGNPTLGHLERVHEAIARFEEGVA